MGVIGTGILGGVGRILFGQGRNVIAETAGLWRPGPEAEAERRAAAARAALAQFGDEFARPGRGGFDRFMDGVNRLPRPALALGTIGLFVVAMIDPLWFSARMAGLALVPEPLWWLLGAVVSFYFGARFQAKGQDFRRDMLVLGAAAAGRDRPESPPPSIKPPSTPPPDDPPRPTPAHPEHGRGAIGDTTHPNAALDEWRRLGTKGGDKTR